MFLGLHPGLVCAVHYFWGVGIFKFAFHSFILTLNPIIGKKIILSPKRKAMCLSSTQEPTELWQFPFATQVIQFYNDFVRKWWVKHELFTSMEKLVLRKSLLKEVGKENHQSIVRNVEILYGLLCFSVWSCLCYKWYLLIQKDIWPTCCYQLLFTYCFLYLLGNWWSGRNETPSLLNLELTRAGKQKKIISTTALSFWKDKRPTWLIWVGFS